MTFEALSRHLDAFLSLKLSRARSNPHFGGDQRRRGMTSGCWAAFSRIGDSLMSVAHSGRLRYGLDDGRFYPRKPYRDEHRLLAVRAFLLQLRPFAESTGIPQVEFRSGYKRRTPYIFSDQEILQLMELAARTHLRLRAATVSNLIGLLASTGIRIGEALRLTMDDVRLDAKPPYLYVHETKLGKSRNVVLHRSTVTQLRSYLKQRDIALRGHQAEPFFTNTIRRPLIYNSLRYTFQQLLKRAGVVPAAGQRRPTLHCLRHIFAVKRLTLWQREGADIRQRLPRLSVYMGHVGPESTYWYLSATPELLQDTGALFDPEQMRRGGTR